ncbi:MAG: eukaryotic-like serine/threonine-protein kinase [Frankiales bacterium]|nr:eukaryotic-like serine/threonine-protein kinase [Frankiales bacterium]
MTDPNADEGGDRILCGRYRLRERIGQGGMGVVWLAHDELLDRPVAVKEIVNVDAGHDVRERLVREARAAARLDHPGAVRVYDIADEEDDGAGGAPWIVMEVLSGQTLQDAIRADGPMPAPRVAAIGAALIDAIDAAHRAGILHRDIKPANVQLCEDGRVVLTDFGIASMTGDASITRTGDIIGSPAYMSPERARGRSLDPASDLFSLGATLYAAVEGRPPFDRETPVATLTALVTDPPDTYQHAGELKPVLDGLLAKEPGQRLTAATARAMLEAISRGETLPPLPPPPHDDQQTQVFAAVPNAAAAQTPPPVVDDALPLAHPVPPRRRLGRVVAVLAALAVLIGGGIAAWQVTSGGSGGNQNATKNTADGPFAPGAGPVPADWTVRQGPSGWSLATPADWQEQNQGSVRRWRRDSPYAYIAVVTTSGSTAAKALASFQSPFASGHEAYHQESLDTTTTFRGTDAATTTFTYRDVGTDLKASLLAYKPSASASRVYLLWWQTKPDGWNASQEVRSQVLASFRPSP